MESLDEHRLPTVGERVGRYEVLAPLAAGGMGAVYVARLSGIGGFRKLLALKLLRPELADDPYFVQMFLDECRVVSQISHRNVVQVFDSVMHRGAPCMVMEFLRGRPLSAVQRALASDGRRLPDALAACVLEQAARGLQAAHTLVDEAGEPMQVVHRDISPDNLQICHDGAVKIVDFGIASSRARSASTRHDAFKGKIAYAAPERIAAPEKVDARADAWSLAVVGWELFAGRRLFDADNEAATMWTVIHGEIPSLAQLRPDLPTPIVEAIMTALERSARDRAHDMEAFATAMSALTADSERALGRLVSERFDLDREHDVLLTTIARELEDATTARRAVLEVPSRASRRRWAWIPGFAAALGLATLGVQWMRPDVESPSPSDRAVSEPAAPRAARPDAAPVAEVAAPPEAAVSGPEPVEPEPVAARDPAVGTPEPPEPARRSTPRRATKRRRIPDKRGESAAGALFNNPYRQ